MPYKSQKIKIANTIYDRRIKLNNEQRADIKRQYNLGVSMRELARLYQVDRVLIKIIVDENEKQKRAEYSKQYKKEHRPCKEDLNAIMREHRRYKQKLYKDNKITPT